MILKIQIIDNVTIDETMNETLYNIRHSLSHLLAMAALKHDKDAKLGVGPVIEDGFYYDIKFSKPLTQDDLSVLEGYMREYIREGLSFSKEEISAKKARDIFADQPFKGELIDELEKGGTPIIIYKTGDVFKDLCEGGHVHTTKEIPEDAFSLTHLAGAYWRGNEKNQMLTRVYGVAFSNKKLLEEYRTRREEAKARDHRTLNETQGYFMISEKVGKGLPLFLPKGAYIKKQLEEFIYEKERERGYTYIQTPILTRKNLYEQSGHLRHYSEDMYKPIDIDGEEYYLRPMNCPHHHQVFSHMTKSYRDLPLRLAEFGLVHRYERSGVLSGLIRSRCFTQNDAHIYCVRNDLKKELLDILELFKEVYDEIFNIHKYWFRLSLPDFKNDEKFGDIKNKERWEEATAAARGALEEFGARYVEGGGEAAFYGPKIDVQIKNVNNKEDTIATIQVDFYSSDRFNLSFINTKGEKEQPVIIHRAIMGSFERFLAFLVEQYAGAFPTWLLPTHATLIPVAKEYLPYAKEVGDTLKKEGVVTVIDTSTETLGKKVHSAKMDKVPYFLVIGGKEAEKKTVSVESRDEGALGSMALETFASHVGTDILNRKDTPFN